MTRTKEEQAAYMREYRARRKQKTEEALAMNGEVIGLVNSVRAMQESVNALGAGDPKDRRIAELEAELADLKALRPWGDIGAPPLGTVARETSLIPTVDQWKASGGPTVMHEGREMIVPVSLPKPGFLAAPDDDCGTCKHDRHAWGHILGACQFPIGAQGPYAKRKQLCLCDDYDLGFE